jgi:formate/nitrite transporter FocA (FNT family)
MPEKPVDEEAKEARKAVPEAPATGHVERDFFILDEIFQRILATADSELDTHTTLLFWSGLAAGLALGLTFFARALFTSLAPSGSSALLGNLFYPIGFAIVVLGRYQLFTENTLTPVTLVLTRLASLRDLARLWGIVYAANLLGAFVIAGFLAQGRILDPQAAEAAVMLAQDALAHQWLGLFSRAIIAGWLVATMVWLVHSARDTVSRLLLVWLTMYLVGVGGLFHIITGSVEVFYLAVNGGPSLVSLIPRFIVPVTVGNIIGGVAFVAILNYMQVAETPFRHYGDKLSWRAWIWGKR